MLHILSDTGFLNLTKLSEQVLVYHIQILWLLQQVMIQISNIEWDDICHEIEILHIIAARGKVTFQFWSSGGDIKAFVIRFLSE